MIATGRRGARGEPPSAARHRRVIYLETSVKQQLSRTRRDRKRRCAPRSGDREEVLRELLALRDPLYREIADLVVRTDGRGAKSVVRGHGIPARPEAVHRLTWWPAHLAVFARGARRAAAPHNRCQKPPCLLKFSG